MAEEKSIVLHNPAQQSVLGPHRRSSDASSRKEGQWAIAFEQWITTVLPTGSVMVYESLAPSFNNQGKCYTSNQWLTLGLVATLTLSSFFFSFTDSIVHEGKTYFGMARRSKLKLIGLPDEETKLLEAAAFDELKKRRRRWWDFVHAAVSALVFLAMAINDVGFQNCFFPRADMETQLWFKVIPSLLSVCSVLVFSCLPQTRNKLGLYGPVEEHSNGIHSHKKLVINQVQSFSANLARLLPTVPVVLYQSVYPYLTNQGQCHTANWWATMVLVAICTLYCVYFVFTDSFVHEETTYSGVALCEKLEIIFLSDEKKPLLKDANFKSELEKRRLKKLDWFHAILSALVFLAMAFNDVGFQSCFFPQASADARQLFRSLPLGAPILASIIFTIFPTKRRTLGADDSQKFSNSTAINDQVSNVPAINDQVSNGPASTATSIIITSDDATKENYVVSLPPSFVALATGRKVGTQEKYSFSLPGHAILSAMMSLFHPQEAHPSVWQGGRTSPIRPTSPSLEEDLEEALVLRPSTNLESGQVTSRPRYIPTSTVTSPTNKGVDTQEAQPSGSTNGNQQSSRRGVVITEISSDED